VKQRQPRPKFASLTPQEQQQRKQLGYIIMCWAIVGSVVIDQFLLKGRLIPPGLLFRSLSFLSFFPFDQFLLTLFVPAITVWWVYRVYWK
jgi:hypothetical protein